ncbi:hypothetical protein B0H34DRAFT_79027 [Crassisporium funariophilum]|nr:hypothetical protein B0H34DRAFT_79027 [Crassisporium funariophilum]
MDHLKQHNEGDERHDLPALENAMSASVSADAAATFERTRTLHLLVPIPMRRTGRLLRRGGVDGGSYG